MTEPGPSGTTPAPPGGTSLGSPADDPGRVQDATARFGDLRDAPGGTARPDSLSDAQDPTAHPDDLNGAPAATAHSDDLSGAPAATAHSDDPSGARGATARPGEPGGGRGGAAAGGEPRTRLHPLTPVLKSVRTLALIVAAVSWRGLQNLGPAHYAEALLALLVLVLLYSALAWRFTGYEVVGRELRVHEGVLSRRVRAVPLERLQSIEVVQPLLARLAGLAELRLDMAGGAKSEAPLAFLPLAEATALRARLLAMAAAAPGHPPAAAASSSADEPAAEAEPADVFRVDNTDVLRSQLLTPPVMFTPLAVLFIVGQLMFNSDFGIFALASMVTAVAGTVGAPAMRVLNFWNFRLGLAADGRLRIRHGLLETRSQLVAPHRVQSLTVTWPLLWRAKGWLRVTLAVAGQRGREPGQESRAETDRLLPVATVDTARSLIPLAVPGVDLLALPLVPVPAAAGWLAPLRRQVLRAGLLDGAFASVDGLATRVLTVVPYARIQSVRLRQGPLQRRLGLATVLVDVAGGAPATAAHRELAQAVAWADELTARARAAREAG
ncbi:PH domain-containing protein [Catellatospora sp. KI3]|uniref:PH domain-containing protein n=1 Tax=Catellatospora sp. KI3 TaxID=3041620 RepID=UPI0024828117|nr:PH domain-containing protein [Catellatospora sp. KI3]MDI1465756.1 PH domain-containing protein [Catellatospora sp. KI3]